jgi:FlaA1/EpsC-like NDP-sugar epimerase
MHCEDKRLKTIMADVRDFAAVDYALGGIDTVLHLAAMKRVDLSEENCREAASINVIGTMNLLKAFRGDTFVLMSTDKAVEPANCYGATKLVAEKLVLEQARKSNKGCRFMILRSGNIMGSTGSVLEIWKHQIEEKNEITVTNLDMQRFCTSVEEVVKLYITILDRGENGKVYLVPDGEAVVLRDLVQKAIQLYGNENTKIRVIGLRPGERMQEKMRTADEVNTIVGFEETVEAGKAGKRTEI